MYVTGLIRSCMSVHPRIGSAHIKLFPFKDLTPLPKKRSRKGGHNRNRKSIEKRQAEERRRKMPEKKPNPWFKARALLEEDYENSLITNETDPSELHKSGRDEYKAVRRDLFIKNFKKLKDRGFKTRVTQKKEVNPWYIAKPLLYEMYIKGDVTDSMEAEAVQEMKAEFKAVKLDRFKDNFNRMKKNVKKDKDRADEDLAGYLHDMTIHTLAKDLADEWHGSEAEELLRQAVKAGLKNDLKPRDLYSKRKEYQEFGLETFRKHIYQEERGTKESNYWLVKKTKKEKKKQAKLQGKKYEDDDNDFFDPVLDFNTLENWDY